jgi:hypothetical protein
MPSIVFSAEPLKRPPPVNNAAKTSRVARKVHDATRFPGIVSYAGKNGPDMKISELGSLLPLDCIFMVGGEAWAS